MAHSQGGRAITDWLDRLAHQLWLDSERIDDQTIPVVKISVFRVINSLPDTPILINNGGRQR